MKKKVNIQNLKPFKKGSDARRNMKGRPPKLPQLDVLLDEVLGDETNGITAAKKILQALFSKASKGDVRAAEVLLDRAYGKAKLEIQHLGTIDTTVIIKRNVISNGG